jgi:hypothetical protein
MTEQDERAIYEWAYPELKSKDWALSPAVDRKGNSVAPVAIYEDATGRTFGKPLRPLDHNFAFDVCVPRLVGEGVKVMYNNMGSGEWWLDAPNKDAIYASPDFYTSLVTYIRGVK